MLVLHTLGLTVYVHEHDCPEKKEKAEHYSIVSLCQGDSTVLKVFGMFQCITRVHFCLFSEVRDVTSCHSKAHFETSPSDWRQNDGPSKMTFALMHLRNKQKNQE